MSYDPTRDEAIYSRAEVDEVIDYTLRRAFAAGMEMAFDGVVGLPLTIEGRWKPDTVYAPQSLVYHGTKQWISKAQTASEPGANNALWRHVDLPAHTNTEERK